jgi:uridylate kinase
MDALQSQFEVMDAAAFSLCMENAIPIVVLNILQKGNMTNFLLNDKDTGTIVSG